MIIPTYTETSTHTHPHAHDSYTHTRTYARTLNCAYTRLMLCVMHCLYFNGVGASRHVYILLMTSCIHTSYDVIMGTMASQIIGITIGYSTVYSGADQRKHQSTASLAFVRGIHRWPMNSPHKWPVTRKMFPFDDAIMFWGKYRMWELWLIPPLSNMY